MTVKPDDPIFSLPPYKVESLFVSMSETMDWGLELMGIPQLWRLTKGEDIVVAVLDTGCAMGHHDLRDAILDAKDFTGSMSGPSDVQGHGTHVAGTIAARENNTGVIGVAPKCKLLIAKVLGDDGTGSSNSVAAGVKWAASKGADIISMSLGSSVSAPGIHNAIKDVTAQGKFVITAAGNEGPRLDTVGYPGRYPETIAVGAIDRSKRVTRFSSRGNTVDICAPGDQILSTYPPNNLAKLSGTSMATPFVSGVVALMLAKKRKLGTDYPINNVNDLRAALKRTASDAGDPGYDHHYGFGIIDPEKLLSLVANGAGVGEPVVDSKLELLRSDFTEAGWQKWKSFFS